MGVLYTAIPVDDNIREWFADLNLLAPALDGRAPTPNELKSILDAIEDQSISYNIHDRIWQAQIDDLVSPETGPWTQLNVINFETHDSPCEFYFSKGCPKLVVKVTHRIAEVCGPIAIVPDTRLRTVGG